MPGQDGLLTIEFRGARPPRSNSDDPALPPKGLTMQPDLASVTRPVWPWKRLAAGLAAALLLTPVPAMALTFTTGWVASYSQAGGPTPPTPVYTDATAGGRD